MIYFIEIIFCIILTLAIEYIPIVWLLKVKNKYFIAVNVLTNVLANIVIIILDISNIYNYNLIYNLKINRDFIVLILEVIIVISEFYLYYLYFEKKKVLKVLIFTIIANILSYNLGIFIINVIQKGGI